MKKLLFATAIAASAAAFADGPINATAFANAGEYDKNTQGSYFYFAGESDSSVVTNTSPSTEKHTANFESADDENYLALDTEGGTLWRSLATIGSETVGEDTTYSLGAARAVASTGTYLDTLVQFTVTEDEAPEVGSGDKLAIWLQAGEGTTNLMVKANLYDFNEAPEATATSFVLAASEGTVTINPGDWYRLTVKAIPNVMNTDENGIIPGFEIYVDGIQMRATTPQFTADMVTMMTSMEVLSETASAAIADNKLFPSLDTMGAQGDTPTLQGVGFQGTGAVDEIVWTEENPFPAAPAVVEFTLTGGENATVSYVIGSEASQTWDGTSAPISVESGATVTFTAAPESGYTYAGVTAEGWTASGDNLVCTTNSTESIELAVPNAVALVTLTDPGIANATLTSPALPAQYASGATVELTWTAAPGYTFPNDQTTITMTVTVGVDDLAVIAAGVASSLSKQTFTVAVVDIENATIAATTNNTALTDALSENTVTNQYAVEYGDTVTVTAEAAPGFEFVDTPEGWTLNDGVLSFVTNNVTADVELAAPATRMSIVEIAIPTAATGLIYDGTAKTGVAAGTGYTLSGDVSATAAGNYTATATLESGYAWVGGLTGDQTINWSIAQATVTATVSLDPASATYDSTKTAPSVYTTPSISFGGVTLAPGTDYTVAWSPAQVTEAGEYTCTVSPVAGGNYTFTVAEATLTITAQQAEDWVDDVSTITAGTKASEQYPSLAGTAVANADAKELTTWAKGVGNVLFADAGEDEINVEAFLLNIANDSTAEQIAAEKDAFVLNITIAADGTPVVTTPTGKTYNGTLQLKGSTNLSTWTNIVEPSKSYNFYKYELSLPAAE